MTLFYVIRHKPTGTLLPARVNATHYDFSPHAEKSEPRLFRTERAAKNCTTCWAQGAWRQETKTESHGWEFAHLDFDYKAEPAPHPEPGRKREDLEVVPAELELLS